MLWKRLALAPIGLLLALLMLEGGLQIAAFFTARATRGELPVAWATGNLRVLCLGDSNTYGVWLARREQEAYPQQLEALWNERIAAPKLEVLNFGFPGTNSSRLVRDLPRLLETFDPDIVVVMVGVNDFWTMPFAIDEAQESRPQKNFLERHSLVYRFYHLIRRARVADKLEIVIDKNGSIARGARHKARIGDLEFDQGFRAAAPGVEGDSFALEANLRRMIELARAAGTSIYLMSYPATRKFYASASTSIIAVALETGAPLIDLAAIFELLCPTSECPDLLFEDGHPRASGYRIIVEEIMKRLGGSTPPSAETP